MMWTKEQKYRPIEDVSKEELEILKKQVDLCPWRLKFHIQASTGLINDPNGFAFYNGEYHLFYQWFPLGAIHGLKYWYHLKSKDLINWEDLGIGIKPDHYYDNYGAYTGSAIEHEGKLHLIYTGNRRDENWVRHPMQALAIMNSDCLIEKLEHPVVKDIAQGYTDHFRDPKIWKDNEMFYFVLGAQRKNLTGATVVYESTNLKDWTFKGEIKTRYENFGYMWECPDYFELDNKGILAFCPQGIEKQGYKYNNIYQSGYIIGNRLDLDTLKIEHGTFIEFDNGFDFYAPQTTLDNKGRRLLVGWVGLPDVEYPSDVNNWAHCFTLIRELKLVNNRIYQIPVDETKSLRKEKEEYNLNIDSLIDISSGETYELICEFSQITSKQVGFNLRVGRDERTTIMYDVFNKELVLDRSLSGVQFDLKHGTTRKVPYDKNNLKLNIFVDTSLIEIFVNDGEYTLTSRIFPTNNENKIQVFSNGGNANMILTKYKI